MLVLTMLLYLLIECSVLEPIFRGYFVEIMFFVFVMKYALITKSVKLQGEYIEAAKQ